MKDFTVLLLLALSSSSGCVSDALSRDMKHELVLVQLKPDPNRIMLTARFDGVIEPIGDCVYIVSSRSAQSFLAIWPPGYEIWRVEGKSKGVIEKSTGRVMRFGVPLVFGGGSTGSYKPGKELKEPIPQTCHGPFFMIDPQYNGGEV